MTLDSDVVLVAEERDAPYFFLVRAAVEAWDARGGVDGPLGLPTSNPLVIEGAFRQYFQSGYMEILNSTGEIVYVEVEDLAADLPDLGSLSGKLLRQSDATAWLITDDLTRKRIPDGLTFACLVGDPEFAATASQGTQLQRSSTQASLRAATPSARGYAATSSIVLSQTAGLQPRAACCHWRVALT